ncbi:hypothetical protein SD457_15100 [Coprobacillaceae bacterium CR2/5/TPMF4]|nr:hypothetical protein SD457_15100 [Coprobacillaceae bacterium CR2/5/TPMF4]
MNDRYQSAAEMLDDINTCLDRPNEEKLVFSYDSDDEPTIVVDPRTAFSSNDTSEVKTREEKPVEEEENDNFFKRFVKKSKA